MGFIPDRAKSFATYLQRRFGIELPPGVAVFYAKGLRVGNRELMKSHIHGELGYGACDLGFNPTNAMIQNFGHLAKRNVVEAEEDVAKAFAAGKDLECDMGRSSRYVIRRYKSHSVGMGYYDRDRKKILNRIPEKRRREIINSI